jgi:hypothetical protein
LLITLKGVRQLTLHAIYEQDVLISAYGPDRTDVLEAGGGRYRVPISWALTAAGQEAKIIVVLRRGDPTLTPSGGRSLVRRTGELQVFTTQAIHSDSIRSSMHLLNSTMIHHKTTRTPSLTTDLEVLCMLSSVI